MHVHRGNGTFPDIIIIDDDGGDGASADDRGEGDGVDDRQLLAPLVAGAPTIIDCL